MTRRALNAAGELLEDAWQRQVIGLASFYGWRTYHTHDSRRSQRGYPDLTLIRPPELIFAELKTRTGRISPEQAAWLADLEQIPGVDTYIWRPADFDDVHARLARGRNLTPASFDTLNR